MILGRKKSRGELREPKTNLGDASGADTEKIGEPEIETEPKPEPEPEESKVEKMSSKEIEKYKAEMWAITDKIKKVAIDTIAKSGDTIMLKMRFNILLEQGIMPLNDLLDHIKKDAKDRGIEIPEELWNEKEKCITETRKAMQI